MNYMHRIEISLALFTTPYLEKVLILCLSLTIVHFHCLKYKVLFMIGCPGNACVVI